MSYFYNSVEYICSFLECFVLIAVCMSLFTPRLSKAKTYAVNALLSLAVMLITTFLNTFSIYSYFTSTMWAAMCCGIILLLYRTNIIKALSVCVTYLCIINAFDFLVVSIVELLFSSKGFTISVMTQVDAYRTAFLIFVKLVLVLSYIIIAKSKITYKLDNKISVILTGCSLFAFFCTQYLITAVVSGNQSEIQKSVLIAWLFIILFFVGILAVIKEKSELDRKEYESRLVESRLNMVSEEMDNLTQSYKEKAKLSHDYKNHLSTVSTLIKNKSYSELEEYISELSKSEKDYAIVQHTGVEAIDAVISGKLSRAKDLNIHTEVKSSYINCAGISKSDICAVLSNLLDNAVEGCENATGEKYVRLSIEQPNSMLLITVENSSDSAKVGDGSLKTTKEDKNSHGFGMKIVESIAEKYSGYFKHQCENGVFKACVLLSQASKSRKI